MTLAPAPEGSGKLLYTIPETVALTGIGRTTLYDLIHRGELESVRVGRSRFIPADGLRDFILRLRDA
jgi:excisionase family DNA binding protein